MHPEECVLIAGVNMFDFMYNFLGGTLYIIMIPLFWIFTLPLTVIICGIIHGELPIPDTYFTPVFLGCSVAMGLIFAIGEERRERNDYKNRPRTKRRLYVTHKED